MFSATKINSIGSITHQLRTEHQDKIADIIQHDLKHVVGIEKSSAIAVLSTILPEIEWRMLRGLDGLVELMHVIEVGGPF